MVPTLGWVEGGGGSVGPSDLSLSWTALAQPLHPHMYSLPCPSLDSRQQQPQLANEMFQLACHKRLASEDKQLANI